VPGFEVLGSLPKNFKFLVYGLPGSGKSTFCLLFADKFNGNTLYCAIEEGFSESFSEKIVRWEITSSKITVSDAKSLREIKNDLVSCGGVSLVIMDSLSLIETPDLTDIAQIWIVHSTKDGHYKGDSDLGHVVDVILRCDSGAAFVEKNRFGVAGQAIRVF
jgi:predicted ATP-dependent serine protease